MFQKDFLLLNDNKFKLDQRHFIEYITGVTYRE